MISGAFFAAGAGRSPRPASSRQVFFASWSSESSSGRGILKIVSRGRWLPAKWMQDGREGICAMGRTACQLAMRCRGS